MLNLPTTHMHTHKPPFTYALVAALLLLACFQPSAARPQLSPFGGLERLRAHSAQFMTIDGAYQDEFLFTHGSDSVMLKCKHSPHLAQRSVCQSCVSNFGFQTTAARPLTR
jgi:hypothetical protein